MSQQTFSAPKDAVRSQLEPSNTTKAKLKPQVDPDGYSRCVKLLELGDGLRLLAGHEPINEKADY